MLWINTFGSVRDWRAYWFNTVWRGTTRMDTEWSNASEMRETLRGGSGLLQPICIRYAILRSNKRSLEFMQAAKENVTYQVSMSSGLKPNALPHLYQSTPTPLFLLQDMHYKCVWQSGISNVYILVTNDSSMWAIDPSNNGVLKAGDGMEKSLTMTFSLSNSWGGWPSTSFHHKPGLSVSGPSSTAALNSKILQERVVRNTIKMMAS